MTRLLTPVLATALCLAVAGAPQVADAAPPAVAGPAPTTVVEPTAADPSDPGWSVGTREDGRTLLSWTARRRIPVTDDRPRILRDGVDLGPTVVRGATVEVPVASAPGDLDRLDVVLHGRSLITGRVLSQAAGALRDLPLGPDLGFDPAARGSLATTQGEYRLDPLAVPGFRNTLPVTGRVVAPVDGPANAPLVLFLHGRHEACFGNEFEELPPPLPRGTEWRCAEGTQPVPSDTGYTYLQRLLAGQGYVTVSIDANAINAQDFLARNGGSDARALLVREHLRAWAGWASGGSLPFAAGVRPPDPDRVVLVGHSRGGEGVNRAAEMAVADDPFAVIGQVLVGPTNFGSQSAARTPTVTVLPGCDGDVADLQGQSYTEVATLALRDPAAHASVLVPGANHNYFNTEWTPGRSVGGAFDDGGWIRGCAPGDEGRLTAAEQRAVGSAYVAGAVAWFTGTMPEAARMFDGTVGHVASAPHPVRSHAVGGERSERTVPGSTVTQAGAMTVEACRGEAGFPAEFRMVRCAGGTLPVPHWPLPWDRIAPRPVAAHLAWDEPGGVGGLRFDSPLDLSRAQSLDLRTVVQNGPGVRVRVRLTDADGAVATLAPDRGGYVPALARAGRYPVFAGVWGQAVRVSTARLSGIDLRRVASVEYVAVSGTGRLWLLDVQATRGGDPVLGEPMPTITFAPTRVPEGDVPGQVVEVPYTIRGTLRSRARVVVGVVGPQEGEGLPTAVRVLDLPAGTTTGVLPVPVDGNDVDNRISLTSYLDVRPRWGVMPTTAMTPVTAVDDEPAPELRVTLRSWQVAEGEAAVLRVRLSAPSGDYLGVPVRLVPPESGRALSFGDVSARFRERWLGKPVDLSRPLHGRLWIFLEPGQTSLTVRIPLLADGRREGPETVQVRVNARYPALVKTMRLTAGDR